MGLKEKFENDLALAVTYVPHLRYDKKEPFPLEGIGYTVYWQTEKSPSCRRTIEAPEGGAAIEYAFYYDFDIQHLEGNHSGGCGADVPQSLVIIFTLPWLLLYLEMDSALIREEDQKMPYGKGCFSYEYGGLPQLFCPERGDGCGGI